MHTVHGAPGAMVSGAPAASSFTRSGTAPIAGCALLSYGTSMRISRMKVPSPSNTWMRRLPRSATKMFPFASAAMLCGVLNSPGFLPRSPHDFSQRPSLSTLATRELM